MVISKKEHKAIFNLLFIEETVNPLGQKEFTQKRFNLEDLADAGSALKKLKSSVDETKQFFLDEDLEFTLGETMLLKKLFDAEGKWTADQADDVFEIKALFDGKKEETPVDSVDGKISLKLNSEEK